MKKYIVSFEDYCEVLNEEQLLKFVKIAVINNKDIGAFSVRRIKNINVDGHPSYILA